ncbi:MAG: translation elongation factor-like protein [Deltaproteobacteria bacterium]|nr:translation elongation factor-like protein [Candidatus Zymogenaceae bacterium]
MSEEVKVGEVIKFFAKPSVAAIKATGPIKVGDELHFKGATTDFVEVVVSMQIDNTEVTEVGSGALVGIKTKDRVRPGDHVMKAP